MEFQTPVASSVARCWDTWKSADKRKGKDQTSELANEKHLPGCGRDYEHGLHVQRDMKLT